MYNDALSNAYSLLENANNILYQEKCYRSSSYSGYRSLFEEDEKKDEKEGFFKRSYDSVKNGVNSVIDFIKKYTMQFYNWVKSIVEAIVDRVKKLLGMVHKEAISEEWKKQVEGKKTYTSADMEKPVEKLYEKVNKVSTDLEKIVGDFSRQQDSQKKNQLEVIDIELEKKEILDLEKNEVVSYEESLKLFSYLTKKNKEISDLTTNISNKTVLALGKLDISDESNKGETDEERAKLIANRSARYVQDTFLKFVGYSKALVSILAGVLEKNSNKYAEIVKKLKNKDGSSSKDEKKDEKPAETKPDETTKKEWLAFERFLNNI
jgi:hypothetical protein